jgi:hypothetical protein
MAFGSSRTRESIHDMAQRMADLMIDRTRIHGHCSQDDLCQAGFTEQDITRCWPTAQSLAGFQLNHDSDK